MRSTVTVLAFAALSAFGLIDARAAAAQYVRGGVYDADTGTPVPGAMVVLVDERGEPRASVLANPAGLFVINARTPGAYSLRVQRIGFRDVVTAPFVLQAGRTLEQNVRVTPEAIVLEGITAEARRRCVLRPRQGLAVATLWGEARKALEAAQVTDRDASYRFRVQSYRRNLDVRSMRVLREESSGRAGSAERSPFVSAPAEQLLEDGFVQLSDTASVYYAPDADVLLSDRFLGAYCFRIAEQRGAPGELIGLAFEPADRTGPPAVQGTLWLDRRTFELQYLEYRYTRAPLLEGVTDRVGGRVEFESLPNGTWIVRRWRIRMPELELRAPARRAAAQRPVPRITALVEEGGEVMEVLDPAGTQRIRAASLGTLTGAVFDSAAAIPLAGAVVHLEGTERSVVADDQGRYRMDDVREGDYHVTFTHPVTALYDVELRPVLVSMAHGDAVHVDLAVPLAARGSGRLGACSRDARPRPGFAGVLTGSVTDAFTGQPLPGATVVLSWDQPDGAGGSVTHTRTAVADADGNYVACGLPERRGELRVVISLHASSSSHGTAPTPSGGEGIKFIDFTLRMSDSQAVVIVALDAQAGGPVPDATVSLGALRSHVTDRFGRVVFDAVPPGQHAVSFQHESFGTHVLGLSVGADPETFELHVPAAHANDDATARLRSTAALALTRVTPNVVARAEIERVLPTIAHAGHIAQRIPGLHAREFVEGPGGVQSGLCVRSPRAARSAGVRAAVLPCAVLILDDVPADPQSLLNLAPDLIEAVEFLEPAAAAPRYGAAAGQVGALLVWTRGRGPWVAQPESAR